MAEDGRLLDDGEVGEIVFRGPSVSKGYFNNPEATEKTIVEEWLHTGDLGFIRAGQLYVSGRIKDLIILNGRNYYPQSIEWEVEQLEGVRRGNVVAFSVPGQTSEVLCVAAETKIQDADKLTELSREIREKIQSLLGLQVKEVKLVAAGSLPKTSSGKLQRRKARQLYLAGLLGSEGSRVVGANATRVTVAKHVTTSALARIGHEIKRPARNAFKWVTGSKGTDSN